MPITNSKLVNVIEVVDLDVTVDSNMHFNKHINKIAYSLYTVGYVDFCSAWTVGRFRLYIWR